MPSEEVADSGSRNPLRPGVLKRTLDLVGYGVTQHVPKNERG
jgi:hypothetical protein